MRGGAAWPSLRASQAGWACVRIVIALLCVLAPMAALAPLKKHYYMTVGAAMRWPFACISVLCILGAYAGYVRWIERRRVGELGGNGAAVELSAGLGIGALLFTLCMAILAGAGAYQISGRNEVAAMLATIPGFVTGAVFEELVFRAILFRILEEALGSWIALFVSALVFGVMHFANPGSGLLGALVIAVEAGVMLGAAYMATRRLWLCIGIHFAWNFSQGGIFSVAVSGDAQQGLFQSRLTGAEWLTGGQFGAELSVVAATLCTLAGILMLMHCVRTSRIMQPSWRRAAV